MSNPLVHLNVGGEKITTTHDTLVQLPYFEAVLDRFPCERDEDGSYRPKFIDRCPLNFKKILQYLRDPDNTKLSSEYRGDLEYYGVTFDEQVTERERVPLDEELYVRSMEETAQCYMQMQNDVIEPIPTNNENYNNNDLTVFMRTMNFLSHGRCTMIKNPCSCERIPITIYRTCGMDALTGIYLQFHSKSGLKLSDLIASVIMTYDSNTLAELDGKFIEVFEPIFSGACFDEERERTGSYTILLPLWMTEKNQNYAFPIGYMSGSRININIYLKQPSVVSYMYLFADVVTYTGAEHQRLRNMNIMPMPIQYWCDHHRYQVDGVSTSFYAISTSSSPKSAILFYVEDGAGVKQEIVSVRLHNMNLYLPASFLWQHMTEKLPSNVVEYCRQTHIYMYFFNVLQPKSDSFCMYVSWRNSIRGHLYVSAKVQNTLQVEYSKCHVYNY